MLDFKYVFIDGLDFGLDFDFDVFEKAEKLVLGDFSDHFFLAKKAGCVEGSGCVAKLA